MPILKEIGKFNFSELIMKKIFFIVTISIILLFVGCASKTLDLKPKKPSETVIKQFENYSCNQIDRKIAFLEKKQND